MTMWGKMPWEAQMLQEKVIEDLYKGFQEIKYIKLILAKSKETYIIETTNPCINEEYN
jgi:hypothetical protein